MECTLSFHMGAAFNLHHDNREINVPIPPENRAYEAEHNYYYGGNTSLAQAYETLFGESFRDYNSRIRKDRQWDSYLEKLNTAAKLEEEKVAALRHAGAATSQIRKYRKAVKPAYEIIVALGNRNDTPEFCMGGQRQGEAVDILKAYIETFERNNPNVHLVNAAIHTGESGVAHAHLCVIFYGEHCSRGMTRQCSLTKALEQMGYTSDKPEPGKRPQKAVTKWENAQREALKVLAREHRITIVEGKHSKVHLSTEEYKIQAERERVRADGKLVHQEAAELVKYQDDFLSMLHQQEQTDSLTAYIEQVSLRQELSTFQQRDSQQRQLLEAAWEEFNHSIADYFADYREQKQRLRTAIEDARNGKRECQKNLRHSLRELCEANDCFLLKLVKLVSLLVMYFQTAEKELQIQRLQEANAALKAQAKQLLEAGQSTADVLHSGDYSAIENAMAEYDRELRYGLKALETFLPQDNLEKAQR